MAVLGFFVVTLDALVVNVALPSIGRDLGGGITGLQWVVDGYTLMFAALVLSAGALSDRIGARQADELELASRRRDGTLRNRVTVWVVRHGDDLYVRSWRGRTATWFRSVQARPEGHIRAGGVLKEVQFVDPDPGVDDALDAAYRAKYRRRGASYVDQMVSPEARSATIRLVPR